MLKYDNPLFNALNHVADCAFLSILWIAFSLPLVTMGAASAALYYTTVKVLRKENGTVWREFITYFKTYFKQSTVLGLIWLLIDGLLALGLWLTHSMAPGNNIMGIACVVLLILLNLAIPLTMLSMAYSSRFQFPTKRLFLNSLIIGYLNIGWLVLLWIILLAAVMFLMWMPVAVIIVPGPLALSISLLLERVFKKYMSQEDYIADLEMGRKYRG